MMVSAREKRGSGPMFGDPIEGCDGTFMVSRCTKMGAHRSQVGYLGLRSSRRSPEGLHDGLREGEEGFGAHVRRPP
jgi:hypothetical protein